MKILIIHASAGAGHTKAAEAVLNGIKETTDWQVTLVDILDFTYPFYKKLYQKGYAVLVSRFSWLWGIFFELTDVVWLRGIVRIIRRMINHMNTRGLIRYLEKEKFDDVISTHFFSNEVLGYLKRNRMINARIVSIVTDFDVHSIWLAEGIDQYAVASDFTKERLVQLGVAGEKIKVSGIPVDRKFCVKRDRNALRDALGLRRDLFTVLVATGSFGIGPIEEIITALNGFQILVVCGHNQHLFKSLSQKKQEFLKVNGLVNNMDELMAAADVMITKPGGLSISEALVSHLPLIFFNAIPGQETHNIEVLKKYSIGLSRCSIVQMVQELKKFQASPELLSAAQNNTQRLARPNAVSEIIALIHG